MGIEFHFSTDELSEELERRKNAIFQNLCYIGENAVNVSRLPHPNDWNDITGNLRSSIGYSVFENGKPTDRLNNQYKQIAGKKGDGHEGFERAKQFINDLANTSQADFELVICASMEYAEAVEYGHKLSDGNSTQPRDVLTSAKQKAEELADYLLKDI